jgi:acyl-CoA thioester hydrolase
MEPAPGDSHHLASCADPDHPTPGSPQRFSWDFQVRFMDLNASGHLDNLQILRAVDEARHRLLGVGEPGGPQVLVGLLEPAPPEVAMLVAAHRVEYRRELWYAAAPLSLSLWVCRVGTSSLDVATEVRQTPADPVGALALTTVVLIDTAAQAPWPLSDQVRATLAAHSGPAPAFR